MTTTTHPASMTTEQRDQARRAQFTGTITDVIRGAGEAFAIFHYTNTAGALCAIAFYGKAIKPAFRYLVGDCTPVPGKFTGEPMRCKVDGSSNTVRLSSFQRASKIEPLAVVDGLRVWPVDHWTAYA